MLANIAMIAMTTNNSINVNALLKSLLQVWQGNSLLSLRSWHRIVLISVVT